MRHRVGYRKLGRVTEHRISMLRNQASALLQYERIQTTVRARQGAPAVRRANHLDRQAESGCAGRQRGERHGAPPRGRRDPGPRRRLEAVRDDRAAVRRAPGRLHAPAPAGLPPGRQRRSRGGRAAGQRIQPQGRRRAKTADGEKPKKKTVGGRIREALSGRKKPAQDQAGGRVEKKAKGASKSTTPRKAGGS